MDSSGRGMDPVEMSAINPWKEYWPSWGSNQRFIFKLGQVCYFVIWYTVKEETCKPCFNALSLSLKIVHCLKASNVEVKPQGKYGIPLGYRIPLPLNVLI